MRERAAGPAPVVAFLILILIALAALSSFAGLAEKVSEGDWLRWDMDVLSSVYGGRTQVLDLVMSVVTGTGGGYGLHIISAFALTILLWRRRFREALFFGVTVQGARLGVVVLKEIFDRPRPELANDAFPGGRAVALVMLIVAAIIVARWRPWALPLFGGIVALQVGFDRLDDVLIPGRSSRAFPSGHAANSMAMALTVVVLAWRTRWRWLALVSCALFVSLIGISRVYLGYHYPTDVAAGWLFSLGWVAGICLLSGVFSSGSREDPSLKFSASSS